MIEAGTGVSSWTRGAGRPLGFPDRMVQNGGPMSYIERNLLNGESVLYRTQLHWKVYGIPVLLFLLVFLPLAVWAFAADRAIWATLPLGLALLVLVPAWLKRRSSEFAVTNRRVIIKLGVLNTRSIELLLPKIEAIAVTQSLFGRMFGYGEIVITGSGGTKELFDDIQAPMALRQAVQTATDGESALRSETG
jgi:hypothetical protein